MGFHDAAQKLWVEMRVREREAFLKELEARFCGNKFISSETPLEALALIVDFNSLPEDLQGMLVLALTESGFSAERCVKSTERMTRTVIGLASEREKRPGQK